MVVSMQDDRLTRDALFRPKRRHQKGVQRFSVYVQGQRLSNLNEIAEHELAQKATPHAKVGPRERSADLECVFLQAVEAPTPRSRGAVALPPCLTGDWRPET